MIIILSSEATKENLTHVTQMLKERGYGVHLSEGVETTIVGAVGVPADAAMKAEVMQQFEALPYVDKVVPVTKPYKVVGKQFHPEPTIIDVRGIKIGDPAFVVVMAGPCTVETEEQLMASARAVKAAGAHILRGGAYKPSTSPYSFHGHGEPALKMLAAAREELDMPIITEVLDVRDVDLVCQYADILQVGTRNTFDINAVAAAKELSHLPVIADPSHATGRASLVNAVTRGAIAAGADGVIIEVHPNPEKALKDGAQSLLPEAFDKLMHDITPIAQAVGRHL